MPVSVAPMRFAARSVGLVCLCTAVMQVGFWVHGNYWLWLASTVLLCWLLRPRYEAR